MTLLERTCGTPMGSSLHPCYRHSLCRCTACWCPVSLSDVYDGHSGLCIWAQNCCTERNL